MVHLAPMNKCLECEKNFRTSRTDAKFCSVSCRKKYHRDTKRVEPAPKVVAPSYAAFEPGKDPDLYYQGEITPEIEIVLAKIFKQYEKENKGFACQPYMRKGVRVLTLWERMKILQQIPQEYEADELNSPDTNGIEGTENTFTSLPTVGRCIKCKIKEEVVSIVYTDLDAKDHEYLVCEALGMAWAEGEIKKQGGKILTVNGKNYE